MSSIIIPVHPQTPETRNVDVAVKKLRHGAVILYPTDTGMALGCTLRNKDGIERIRSIRKLPEGQSMTFLCHSISNIAEYARVSNSAFKLIKRLIPGPFTFILPATKLVPTYAHDPKRRTVGIRVPDASFARTLLHALGEPLISISAKDAAGVEFESIDEAVESVGHLVDVVVIFQRLSWMSESLFTERSTIIDMRTENFEILRAGARVEEVREFIELDV